MESARNKPTKKPERKKASISAVLDSKALLRDIASGIAIASDANFFNNITRHISDILDMDYVFVGVLSPDDNKSITTLSAYFKGKHVDNFRYDLENTPCQTIFDSGFCAYPSNIQQKFSKDQDLIDMGAECYIGAPIQDNLGSTAGLLVLMDTEPLSDMESTEWVVQIFSARVASELERIKSKELASESQRTMATLMTNLPGMVYRCAHDEKWTMLYVSDGCTELTGYTPDEFVVEHKLSYADLIHPVEVQAISKIIDKAIVDHEAFQFQYRINTKSGATKWVWEQGRALYDADDNMIALEGFITDITERVNAEEKELGFARILDRSLNEIYIFDADTLQFIAVNKGASDNLGYSIEELRGLTPLDLKPEYTSESFKKLIEPLVQGDKERIKFETVHRRKDGSHYPVEVDLQSSTYNMRPVFIAVILDITDRNIANAEMRKLSGVVQQTADSVMITDFNGAIEYVNKGFVDMTGYSEQEAIGKTPRILKSELHDTQFYNKFWGAILGGEVVNELFINRKKNGDVYYEEKTVTPLKDNRDNIVNFISTGKDITERIQAHERLQFLASHDPLTGLPNRVLFLDRLVQALTRAPWHDRIMAVMFLDLDRFKNINDTLGHDMGDRFLKAMANRIQQSLREGDTIARLGGDEFAILLEDIGQAEDISPLARKLLDVFSKPFIIDGSELSLTTSMGISIYPNDGKDGITLIKNADTAMYRAKDLGKNNYQFYSPDMGAKAFERLTMETNLRHALERNEFVLHYQPQVDIKTGLIFGVEALIRWQHPDLGMMPPMEFIPLAEETGLIVPIGNWVVQTACRQVRAWRAAGIGPLRLAVNLSGRQFNNPDFIDSISCFLESSGMEGCMLELEITESVIMKNAQSTVDRLNTLHGMKVKLAIDDFGTGYSSLSYLKRFPIDTLKIDRSFIMDITNDKDDAEIVKTIITMAHSLNLQVIAEGVETEEQLEFLRSNGCDAMQGYLFSKPAPADALLPLLEKNLNLI